MQLGGFMKLTLQDYPGMVAAMCFTEGCQLRCPYCHNPELVLANAERQDSNLGQNHDKDGDETARAFLAYLEQRKNQLDGVVISGGEPLLQYDLEDYLKRIKNLGLKVKLDTNGLLPDKLQKMIDYKLVDYVALDYKNCKDNFAETAGLTTLNNQEDIDHYYNKWTASLNCLRENRISYELRTTVVKELHPFDRLMRMAESMGRTPGQEPWFLQSFERKGLLICDYTNQNIKLSAYSAGEMEVIKQKLQNISPNIELRG